MNFLSPCPKPLINSLLAGATALALAGCGGGSDSAPAPAPAPPAQAQVVNKAPVSNPGGAQSAKTGAAITLDGSGSTDAEGDALNYAWTLESKPAASTVTLTGSTSAAPTFTPDMSGTYVASLVVNDGKANSEPATVTITVSPVQAVGFDSMPSPFPPNMPSYGFAANAAASLGETITLSPNTPRLLDGIKVAMSSWACETGNWNAACTTTPGTYFEHPITITIYDANGTQLATHTQPFTIPYRPSPDPSCTTATQWKAANGTCYNGLAFQIAFDLRSLNVTLPDTFTYAVSFNTRTYGTQPIGTTGGYDSLNVGLYDVTKASPTVGADTDGGTGTLIKNGTSVVEGYGIMAQVHVTTP